MQSLNSDLILNLYCSKLTKLFENLLLTKNILLVYSKLATILRCTKRWQMIRETFTGYDKFYVLLLLIYLKNIAVIAFQRNYYVCIQELNTST